MTESPYTWTINYTENHGHSWNVTGEVEASIKSGLLTKVRGDGCVKVGVGGEYSGSDNYEWQVTDQLSLGYCKRYKFECFIDTVSTECWRQLADYTWVCPVHYPGVEYGHNLRTCDGSANGQKNEDGGFEHISNYEQPNPCLDCYTGYHD